MNTDIDGLISFFNKFSSDNQSKDEMGEQEDTSSPSSGGGGGIPKWSDSYTLTRGKANMLGKSGEKWQTGLNRGAANQIW
jgi:hypothetical protein